MCAVVGGVFYKGESGRSEHIWVRRLRHEVDPFLVIMEGAIVVRDGMRVTRVTESPIKASVNSSKFEKCKRITGFKRFVANNLGVGGFVVAVICFGGGVSVSHLSG